MPWTVTQIVEHVDRRTERRASKTIDLRMEFFLALDEFCGEQHFWWRKKRNSITAVVGTLSYDLSVASPDLAELNEVLLINPDGVTVQHELNPITDPAAQLASVLNNVPDVPAGYFIDVQTSLQTIFLQAPSSVAQKILYEYWALPMVTDPTVDSISLVPTYSHWGLVYALERRVYEHLYGQEDPRWQMANSRYQEFVAKASRTQSWTSKKTQEARTTASYVNTVQAHGNNGLR